MAAGLSELKTFLFFFNNLKTAARNNPENVLWLYKQSRPARDALDALHGFLARTDFERRFLHGGKVVRSTAPEFEAAWNEYAEKWRFHVTRPGIAIPIRLNDSDPDPDPDGSVLAGRVEQAWKESEIERDPSPVIELVAPDPETEDSFDPIKHDGGAAIQLGIQYLESPAAMRLDLERPGLEDERQWANRSSIGLGAYDYLVNTIGLDVHGVFRRWRKVPVVFMPAHVSNAYRASDKGSLDHLLDDAVKAYVFGARAAAIAMCRAVHDMLRNEHYRSGELENVVAHASAEWDSINMEQITKYRRRANWVMHNYSNDSRLNEEDDRIILNYLIVLKYLVEHAPKR